MKELARRATALKSDGTRSPARRSTCRPRRSSSPKRSTARADIYALGAVGYFLLTGKPPFTGKNVVEILAQHLHDPVAPPSERTSIPIPPDLERVILACLAKSPADRPPSAAALVDALRECQDVASWEYTDAKGWWAERAA